MLIPSESSTSLVHDQTLENLLSEFSEAKASQKEAEAAQKKAAANLKRATIKLEELEVKLSSLTISEKLSK
jgi:hypothetical protein